MRKSPFADYPHQGTRSLQETALRNLSSNAGAISSEILTPLPDAIVHRIWQEIRRRYAQSVATSNCESELICATSGQESFHVWKTFVNSGHGDRCCSHRLSLHKVELPIIDYFTGFTSADFAWTVNVMLDNVDCAASGLKALVSISIDSSSIEPLTVSASTCFATCSTYTSVTRLTIPGLQPSTTASSNTWRRAHSTNAHSHASR